MAEPKTKPTEVSAADFVAAVEHPGRRADGEAVLRLLGELSGEPPVMWGPSVVGFGSYKGPTGDWPVIGFSPRKANLVLYLMPGFEGRAELMARLGRHKIGKSCLYLNRLSDVDQDVLRELCVRSIEAVRERYPA